MRLPRLQKQSSVVDGARVAETLVHDVAVLGPAFRTRAHDQVSPVQLPVFAGRFGRQRNERRGHAIVQALLEFCHVRMRVSVINRVPV